MSHIFSYSQVNGTFSYCLNSWCVKGYFFAATFIFVLIIQHLVWEIKCVIVSGVCEGKERTCLSFYSCGEVDLILGSILFVSICFYTFVISKELQAGCAVSVLNSNIHMEVSFKNVYL